MIQILLVEDQDIIRRGLRALLETQRDFRVVEEADNGQSAIDLLARLPELPSVVLMDIRMPIMDGVQATQQMSQRFPAIKVLVLTTFDDTQYVAQALSFGAKGYLLKDTSGEELIKAIRAIHQGFTQFGPGILEKIITQTATSKPQPKEPPPELLELSPREREVLLLIAQGANNQEIAQALMLSEGTIRNQTSRILSRLNLRDRTQAAIVASMFLPWLENTD
jgi:DNA-binding NarL/FixJ family response regulator